jgi:hypothetical protein
MERMGKWGTDCGWKLGMLKKPQASSLTGWITREQRGKGGSSKTPKITNNRISSSQWES